MFEDPISVVSIWTVMNSWLTPTVLFVILNIMIGTIAVTSGLGAGPKQSSSSQATGQQSTSPPSPAGNLTRSPSVLQRLRSIKLYRSENDPPQTNTFFLFDPSPTRTPPPPSSGTDPVHLNPVLTEENAALETSKERETKEDEEQSMEEVFNWIQVSEKGGAAFKRSKSEKKPGAAEEVRAAAVERKGPRKVKKYNSEKAAFSHFEVVVEPEKEEREVQEEQEVQEEVVVRRRVATTEAADQEVDAKADDFINKFREQLKLQRMESLMAGGSGGSAGDGAGT